MEWIAYCTVCGELDRAPNGPMMESLARVHRRDTGHTTIVGCEPPELKEPRRLGQIPPELRGRTDLYRVVAYGVAGGIVAFTSFDHEPSKEELASWVSGVFEGVDRVYVFRPDDTEEVYMIQDLPIQLGPGARPFPKTYGDWVDLAADIKERDPSLAPEVNENLGYIFAEDPAQSENAKRWLVEKAGELGIR